MAKHVRVPNPALAAALAKAMRSSKDLKNQTALARKSGVAQSTIGRILRGEVNPQVDNLQRLADALRVPIATLLDVGQVESFLSGKGPDLPEVGTELRSIVKQLLKQVHDLTKLASQWEAGWHHGDDDTQGGSHEPEAL